MLTCFINNVHNLFQLRELIKHEMPLGDPKYLEMKVKCVEANSPVLKYALSCQIGRRGEEKT